MLPVCVVFGPKLTDLTEDLVETALTNIETGLHVESSAAVLRSVGNAAAFPLNELHIRQLLLSQDHSRLSVAFNAAESNHPNSTAVLVKSFDADNDSVTSVVREELESEIDHNRNTVCGAIGLVQKERPSIGLDLLDSLITSLSLYDSDDIYDGPSTRIVPILRATLMYDPAATDKAIGAAFSSARPAVQEDFTNVYAQLRKSHHNANQKFHPQLSVIVTNRLWEWIRDERLTTEVRHDALRSLAAAYDLFPSRAANGLENSTWILGNRQCSRTALYPSNIR